MKTWPGSLFVSVPPREDDGTPWTSDLAPDAGDGTDAERSRRRLFHLLSGGGLKGHVRTGRQEALKARQTRFLAVAAVLAAVWLIGWLF